MFVGQGNRDGVKKEKCMYCVVVDRNRCATVGVKGNKMGISARGGNKHWGEQWL